MSLNSHELRAVQLRCLGIYKYFEQFCRENGLTLYVCGGGLIGAMRSGGYIPWDDDIDVFMPRPDYDRLWELWQRSGDRSRYQLFQTGHGLRYGKQLSFLYDLQSPCVRENPDPCEPQFLCMDILPLDAYSGGRFARLHQLFHANLFGLYTVGRPPENHGGFVSAACSLLLALCPTDARRDRAAARAKRRMTGHSASFDSWTELCSGWKYIQKRYPKAVFGEPSVLSFEGTTIQGPTDPDTYLRIAFGDYMTPPPPDKQLPQHGLDSICFGTGDK